jgi:hypothetical protein
VPSETEPPTDEPTPEPTETPSATPTPTPTPENLVVWGDHNCSEEADPVDSLFNLRFDAGLPTATGDCPDMGQTVDINGTPREWGDVDCSGEANPVDGLKILRFDAGMEVDQPGGCPDIGELVSLG